MAINPVRIKVMPKPLSGAGIFEYDIFSLIDANANMAKAQPTPEPNPKTIDSVMVEKSFCCINKAPPNMAQFTAIKGR